MSSEEVQKSVGGKEPPTTAPGVLEPPKSAKEAFVSYASRDASVAHEIVEVLERHGIACWIAPRDVRAGALYADAIVRAISATQAFVLVLSASSIASSHVGKEIERASSKKRPIIALRIDSAPLTPALEYFLSESQWIEAQAGNMEPASLKLIAAIRETAESRPGNTSAVSSGMSVERAAAAQAMTRRNGFLLAAALAVIAVVLTALLVNKFLMPKHFAAQAPPTAASVVIDKSIAVLPFTDMSEKHDQEYFSDGMAEEIIDLLVKVPGLKVIGRTSSFQFKNKNADLRTIGTQLNAAHILEGSVRRSGDQIRITAQLIDTRSGAHEWSETYDRQIGDVLKLQDAIAAAVVWQLQLAVSPDALQGRSALKDKDAYDLMLRGVHAVNRFDREGTDEAAALFQQALDHDPTSADAAFWLASTFAEQAEMGFVAPTQAFEKACRALALALKLGAQTAETHELQGEVHTIYDWDWPAAEEEFRQAVELAPSSVAALYGETLLSLALGRWNDALSEVKAAQAQDPMDPVLFTVLSWIQLRRGHLEEAEAAARRVLDISPTYGWAHYYIGMVLLARGHPEASLLEMQQDVVDVAKQQGLAIAYYAVGKKAESDALLAHMLKTKEQVDGNAFGIAEVYAYRGQSDEAMRWLERAYVQKDVSLYYIKGEPPLKKLETDTRYKAFLRKMNLPV